MKRLLFILVPLVVLGIVTGTYDTIASEKDDEALHLKDSQIRINGLYPGYQGEMELKTWCGIKSEPREIRIRIAPEDDDYLGEGWEHLPPEYYGWFTVKPTEFVLKPGESRIITVTIDVPKGVEYSGKARCELLELSWPIIGQRFDKEGNIINEVGNVSIGLASEWYITMR